MITTPAPSVLHGNLLTNQLAAAGLVTTVLLEGDELILPGLDESQRAQAEQVVDRHASTVPTEN